MVSHGATKGKRKMTTINVVEDSSAITRYTSHLPDSELATKFVRHKFMLNPLVQVTIDLPVEVTEHELERLSAAILTFYRVEDCEVIGEDLPAIR